MPTDFSTHEEDDDLRRLRDAAAVLAEHFDTVHIFVTRHEAGLEDGTVHAQWGAGPYFARSGQIREWVVRQDEQVRAAVRRTDDA